jgi:tetratricopeptide (TPR) repeat protein
MRLGLMAAALAASVLASGCQQRSADPLADARAACAEPGEAEARINACTALLESGELGASDRALAHAGRGEALAEAGDVTEALRDFGAALESDPQNMMAVKGRAAILIESGQLDAAAPLVERLLASGQSGAEANYLNGRILLARGALDDAITAFTRAIDEDERYADAYAERAAAKQRQRDYAAALVDFDQAIAINPQLAPALAGRCWARVLMDADDVGQARADAREAAEIDPRLVDAQLCKGLLHLRDGEWAEARAAYEAALEVEPGNPAALFGRGVARRRGGDDEGRDDMNRARDFDERIARTFEDLGVRTF